ncbi:unnamed protein product [Pleuronectes platessa]|uniref:Uncharacterized protein n=1 Tax=Pleuronectes platessa TaxID=8262 RepID=A0A9N7TLG3_PLEPL|nr:unnamed protein product [Pleuronectes platessa]
MNISAVLSDTLHDVGRRSVGVAGWNAAAGVFPSPSALRLQDKLTAGGDVSGSFYRSRERLSHHDLTITLENSVVPPTQTDRNLGVYLLLPSDLCSSSRNQQLHWSLTLVRSHHWLPVAACIRFKTLVLVYRAVNGSGPVHIQDLIKPHSPFTALCFGQSAAPSL